MQISKLNPITELMLGTWLSRSIQVGLSYGNAPTISIRYLIIMTLKKGD